MILAFKIILLIVLFLSAINAIATNGQAGQRSTAVFLASVIALTVTTIWA